MPRYRTLLLAALALVPAAFAAAAVKAPPPPREYQVRLRYRLPAPRDQHIRQFDAMLRYLESVGFRHPALSNYDREDPTRNYLTGTVPSADAGRLLGDPGVASVLLLPPGYRLPADAAAPVKVELRLARDFRPRRQRVLFSQTVQLLEDLGFREAIGYDHRGFTRLVGTIPAGEVDTLLKDLRDQPEGWLTPSIPRRELPLPIRDVDPIRIVAVTPEPRGVAPVRPLPAPRRPEGDLEKVSRDLRERLAGEGRERSLRVQIILTRVPTGAARAYRRVLEQAAPTIVFEGRLGPVVTALVRPEEVAALARLPEVSVVRLPRAAQARPVPRELADGKVFRTTGFGKDGRPRPGGVRVAVIDGDFRRYEDFIKNGQLPAGTRYLDLTAERNRDLLPDPFPGPAGETGHGTLCALALARPLAGAVRDFVLIRVDPANPYQLLEVARYLNGEPYVSEPSRLRAEELQQDRFALRQRRDDLRAERRAVLENFSQDPEVLARRKAYFRRQRQYERDEQALRDREDRAIRLFRAKRGLRGLDVVSCSLVWDDGYPVDGGSALSRYLDEKPAALWFQASGDLGGQVWAGLFRDVDGNGVLEFAAPDTPLLRDRWTRELDFLGWQAPGKAVSPDLPAGARLRLSVQWREPHDPSYLRGGEDLYRVPLARLRLVLLRQRDPTGRRLRSDDLEEVAYTPGYGDRYGLPQRLANYPNYAVYEQDLEFTVPADGRYALRVEGRVPHGIKPPDVPALPALEPSWELRPRILVEAADAASRRSGRPVFRDYATEQGTLGMPADSRGVITVGPGQPPDERRLSGRTGPALGMELLAKPNLLVSGEDEARYGADLATPVAAGQAARALATGAGRADYWKSLQRFPRVLKLP